MPGFSDIRAGRAYVELFVKNSAFVKGLEGASTRLKNFGAGVSMIGGMIAGMGTAIVGPIIGAAKHFMDAGDQLDKMAARTGLSTNALSELGFAAEQSGTDIDAVEAGIRRLQRAIVDAQMGSQTATDTFRALGIEINELVALNPEEQFNRVSRGLAGLEDASSRAGLAMILFGRGSGTALLPMLRSMEALRREAREMGLSIGPEQAKAAAELNDAWNRVKRTFAVVSFVIGSAVAPVLTELANNVKTILVDTAKWITSNAHLIPLILKIGAGIAAAGGVILAAGAGITAMGIAVGSLSTLLTAAAGMLALFTSPIVLIPAALAGAGAAIWVFRDKIASAASAIASAIPDAVKSALSAVSTFLAPVGNWFGDLFRWIAKAAADSFSWIVAQVRAFAGDATAAWDGIVDAIKAGDLELAGKIATTGLRVTWLRLVSSVTKMWEDFRGWWSELTSGLASKMLDASATIQKVWIAALAFVQKAWESWKRSGLIEGIADLIAPIIARIEGVAVEDVRRTLAEDFARKREAAPAEEAEIDRATAARQAEIDAARDAAKKALEEDAARGAAARRRRIAAAEAEVDAARAELDKLREIAAEERAAGGGPAELGGPGEFILPDFAAAAAAAAVAGTFSAQAFSIMGAGAMPIQERIARAVEKNNEKMDKMINRQEQTTAAVKESGPEFTSP